MGTEGLRQIQHQSGGGGFHVPPLPLQGLLGENLRIGGTEQVRQAVTSGVSAWGQPSSSNVCGQR